MVLVGDKKIYSVSMEHIGSMFASQGVQNPSVSDFLILSRLSSIVYTGRCDVKVWEGILWYKFYASEMRKWLSDNTQVSEEEAFEKVEYVVARFTGSRTKPFLECIDNNPDFIWFCLDDEILEAADFYEYRRYTTFNNEGWVYCFYNERTGLTKIGQSYDIDKRKRSLQNSSGLSLIVLGAIKCTQYTIVEKCLHKHFSEFREKGEWFLLDEPVRKDIVNIFATVAHTNGSFIRSWRLAE